MHFFTRVKVQKLLAGLVVLAFLNGISLKTWATTFVDGGESAEAEVDSNPESLNNFIRLGILRNQDQGKTSQVDASFGLPSDWTINLGVSSSLVETESGTEKTSSSFNAGFRKKLNSYFSAGLGADIWGLKDVFTVKSTNLPLLFRFGSGGIGTRFMLSPSSGTITLPYETGSNELDSKFSSVLVSLDLDLYSSWSIGVSYEDFTYDSKIENLNTIQNTKVYNSNSLSMASSLASSSASISITKMFRAMDVQLSAYESEYVVDQSKVKGSSLRVTYYANERWQFDGQIGRSKAEAGRVALTSDEKEPVTELGIGIGFAF